MHYSGYIYIYICVCIFRQLCQQWFSFHYLNHKLSYLPINLINLTFTKSLVTLISVFRKIRINILVWFLNHVAADKNYYFSFFRLLNIAMVNISPRVGAVVHYIKNSLIFYHIFIYFLNYLNEMKIKIFQFYFKLQSIASALLPIRYTPLK